IDALLARLQRRLPDFSAHQLSIRVSANTGDVLVNPALPLLGDPLPTDAEALPRPRAGEGGGGRGAQLRPHCLGPAPEQPVEEYAALWPDDEIPSGQTELH